jgi:uncharacterized caspase-like protein
VWGGLYNQSATRTQIRQRLREMSKAVMEEDVVFLFLSGHGVVPAGQEMFYFAPTDIQGPDTRKVRETGLNTAMLAEAVGEMAARRVVLIIDACQSGGAVESLAKIAEAKVKVAQRLTLTGKKPAQGDAERGVGIYVIAAATPLQQAVQSTSGRGALITTLLEALHRARAERGGVVWMTDVANYIRRRLPEVSAESGQSHTPMIVSTGLDFPLSR